ncbi:metal-dependent hydrolase [Methanococcoides sp. LMO-2]|uniref:Metal-dependent hydrolase n=1 Tax=Methanococcoides cohabitans TaxID=3136559 RepID=A0ABU9KUR8_9EURY
MPYPIAHVMFFVFCICAVAVYTTVAGLLRRTITTEQTPRLLLLLLIGSFFALYPDITAPYNYLVHGTLEHTTVGLVPTHSLLFSFSALLFGVLIGYAIYREFARALYVGLFAESASLSHLLLDDLAGARIYYFYPISDIAFSVFSRVDVELACMNRIYYMLSSYVVVLFISFVIMLALFSLSHLGFEFRYRSEK